jgi:hypothetical protein
VGLALINLKRGVDARLAKLAMNANRVAEQKIARAQGARVRIPFAGILIAFPCLPLFVEALKNGATFAYCGNLWQHPRPKNIS